MNKDLYKTFLYKLENIKISFKDLAENNIKYFIFDYNFNEIIKPGIIPNNVEYLDLGSFFNQKLEIGSIPHSVKYLFFSPNYNQELSENIIPHNVIRVNFGRDFNQKIKNGDLPNSIKYLKFGSNFNQELNRTNIPNKLIELIVSNSHSPELLNINNFIENNCKKCDIYGENIFIGFYDDSCYKYYDLFIMELNKVYKYVEKNIYINIDKNKKILIDEYITRNITMDKLIGRIILEELVEKVFHPKRLLRISKEFNMDIYDYIEMY